MAWVKEVQRKAFVAYQAIWRDEDGKKQRRTFRDRSRAEAFATNLTPPRRRRRSTPVADRIRAKAEFNDLGCWVWQGSLHVEGYGYLPVGGRQVLAHRLSYEVFVRPIPPGLTIDHLCRNRACVNPQHLEPVPIQVNLRRSPFTMASINAAKTHCVNGHPFSEQNTRLYNGGRWRSCRTCERQRWARASAKRRSAQAVA